MRSELEYLTLTQVEYLSIHLRNLIDVAVYGKEINDFSIRQELMARDRFIETYARKYKIDENAQKLIEDYYEKIAMPLFKLQEDNQ